MKHNFVWFRNFPSRTQQNGLLVSAIIFIYWIIQVRTAWISDDAAITLRTVLNFTHGFGPTFNIIERVQAYTHPLWFLIISFSSLILGNVFYAMFILSIGLSTLALGWLLYRVSNNYLGHLLVNA